MLFPTNSSMKRRDESRYQMPTIYSRIRITLRSLLGTGMAVALTLATSSNLAAQDRIQGPLDQIAQQPAIQAKPMTGPLDAQISRTKPADQFRGALDQAPRVIPKAHPKSASSSMVPTQPKRDAHVSQQPAGIFLSHGLDGILGKTEAQPAVERPQFEYDPQVVPSAAHDDFEIDRPLLEEAIPTTVMQPERPILEPSDTAIVSQLPAATGSQDTTNFSGSFADFQAMTEAKRQAQSGGVQGSRHHVLDTPHYQPTARDYQANGIVGYDDTLPSMEPNYVDGASFGFDRSRLYHPLESPTTQLTGMPTVDSGFGNCYCDEWAGFCNNVRPNYFLGCGGIKATPGHWGLPWLTGCDPCEQTESTFFSRLIRYQPRCGDGCGCRPNRTGCQSTDSAACGSGVCQD